MKRNKFSLSHYKLLSCDMGELVPCSLIEVLPGDSFQQNTNLLVRCSPLLAPVYHPVNVSIHHWFVPTRILWDGWENFITGGPDGMNNDSVPVVSLPAVVAGTLPDYLGVPVGFSGLTNALPFRAYTMIFNEWYRDQDLYAALPLSTGSGSDATTNKGLVHASWEKDYFTTSRPWPQKGPAVSIPLTGQAVVRRRTNASPAWLMYNEGSESPSGATAVSTDTGSQTSTAAATTTTFDPRGTLYADLSGVSAVTINQLREALALQRYEEARARYGSRYVEYLRYLGVRSSDARLQRPEFLGGGRQTIQFSEVVQTGPGATSAVGELKGHGIAAARSNRYRRFFEEHGYVITLITVRPKTMYMQGLFRHWNRRVKDDFWQKEFEHIGQQEVQNKEILYSHSSPDGIFGYQDRYDEYRRAESTVSGDFRNTLNFWHLAREFSGDIALNGSFVECIPTERVFAAPSADVLWIMARHSVQARRMVAKVGTSFIH